MENNDLPRLHKADEGKIYSGTMWMMTLADLLSLLLVFFILIYSMSSVRQGSWEKIIDSIGEAFNSNKILEEGAFSTSLGISRVDVAIGLDLNYLYSILESKVAVDDFLSQKIVLDISEDKLLVSIKNKDIFQGGSMELTEDAQVILFVIGDSIQKMRNKMDIVGWVDKGNKPSDWSLTLDRAIKIAGEFRKYGNMSKMEAFLNFVEPKGEAQDNLANEEVVLPSDSSQSLGRIDIIIRPYVNSVI